MIFLFPLRGVRSLFFAEGGGPLDRLVDGQFKKAQVLGKQVSFFLTDTHSRTLSFSRARAHTHTQTHAHKRTLTLIPYRLFGYTLHLSTSTLCCLYNALVEIHVLTFQIMLFHTQESKSETYTTRDGNTYNMTNQKLGTVMQYEEPKTFKQLSPAEAKVSLLSLC